jgi:hypothetical protein
MPLTLQLKDIDWLIRLKTNKQEPRSKYFPAFKKYISLKIRTETECEIMKTDIPSKWKSKASMSN